MCIRDRIRALHQRGIWFGPASGRQYTSLRKLFAPVADCCVFICVPSISLDVYKRQVELRTSSETEREQRKYHLRAMLVREMRTMPERGDPDEEL